MTTQQIILTVIIIALTTFATRFLPFLIFPEGKKIPKTVDYLERVLPFAMIGMLIVYCFKDVRPFAPPVRPTGSGKDGKLVPSKEALEKYYYFDEPRFSTSLEEFFQNSTSNRAESSNGLP